MEKVGRRAFQVKGTTGEPPLPPPSGGKDVVSSRQGGAGAR